MTKFLNFKELNIEEICLDWTNTQLEIMEHPLFGRIIYELPKDVDFRYVKRLEYYKHNQAHLLKSTDPQTGEEKEKLPSVSIQEKFVYLNRLLKYVSCKLDRDIVYMDGSPFIYNGQYWELFAEKYIEEFLCLCASKVGFYYSVISDYKNKKELYKQFKSDFSLMDNGDDSNENESDKPVLINLRNGTLEVSREGWKLREFNKEDYIRYQLDYEYQPNATCPMFDAFLDEVLPEKEAQDVLMEMIGYCFIPTQTMKLEVSLMLHGEGANGKGVVYDIVIALVGENHVCGYSMSDLSNNPNARAQLKNKLLNYSTELGGRCNADMIKKLISGEAVDIKILFKDVTMMKNYPTKFIFNTNSLPGGAENSIAFFRRWLILPFNFNVPKEKRDIHLSKKLKSELPGIFNRVLAGIKRLMENKNFTRSKMVEEMSDMYQHQTNSVLRFITDNEWVPSVDKNTNEKLDSTIPHIEKLEMYKQYKEYCKDNGCTPSSSYDFGKKLKTYFYIQPKSTNNATWVFAKKENSFSSNNNVEMEESDNDPFEQAFNVKTNKNNQNERT